jgi:hypothetical protein
MPVSVRTFASSGEAAAALSADRGARYLGGGTLVMRALNEGDVSISSVVRANDHALMRIDAAGARVTIGAGVTFARILAERDLGFLHAPARSIGGPAVIPAIARAAGRHARALDLVPEACQRRGVPLSQDLPHQAERRLGHHACGAPAVERRPHRRRPRCARLDGADANSRPRSRARAGGTFARCIDDRRRRGGVRRGDYSRRQRTRQRLVPARDRRRSPATFVVRSGIGST